MATDNDTSDQELDTEEEEHDDELDTKDGDEGDDGKGTKDDKGSDRKGETPEARKARLERQLEREAKKNPDLYKDYLDKKGDKAPDEKKAAKEGDLDYGQKAYLIANGIKDADEHQLARDIMRETHKNLEDTLNSKYFQAELKSLRDDKAAADAIPDKSRRNGSQSRSSVEYWLAKGELPPNTPENQELRRSVVNARAKKEGGGSQFSANPVVGNY